MQCIMAKSVNDRTGRLTCRNRETCSTYGQREERDNMEYQSFTAYLATQFPVESEKKFRGHEQGWFLQWYRLHSLSLQKAAVAEVLNSIHRIPDFPDLTGWVFLYCLLCFAGEKASWLKQWPL
ncbi:hypothetical protein DENSPDRAFT_526835 [Dentipellis sp. KUC8613]|nr:hypothetical protein DENSPDRAFT_526835 [Dentipellis sp. KUC8613]